MVKTRYRKKIRKTLAAIMSVSMILNTVSFSAFASETEENKTSPTVTVTVTESRESGHTTTTTITESEWNEKEPLAPETEAVEESGSSDEQITDSATNPDGDLTGDQVTDSATDPATDPVTDPETDLGTDPATDPETDPETDPVTDPATEPVTDPTTDPATDPVTDPTTDPATDPVTDPTTDPTTQIQPGTTGETTVIGSETKTETVVTDRDDRVIMESESIKGQETEEEVVIKTEVETKEDQVIDTTTTPIYNESSEDGSPEKTTGETQTGEETFGQYDTENGAWTQNGFGPTETTTDPTTESDVTLKDPLAAENEKVELNLNPNNPNHEIDDKEYVYVSWSDIKNNNVAIPKAGTTTGTDKDGNPTKTVTTVEEVKENGEIIGYKVKTVTTTTKTSDLIPGENYVIDSEERAPVTSTPELPEGVKAGTEELKDAAGNVIGSVETIIEEIKDDAGNVIGYTITEVKKENNHSSVDVTASGETTTVDDEPVESIVLPEKPKASESTDKETGIKTVTTVEDVVENGKHIGYKTTTVQTDKNGKELSRSSDVLYGTVVVVNKSTTTDPTTQNTTTDTLTTTTTTTTIKGTTTYTDVVLGTDRTQTEEVIEVTENDTWQLVEADGEAYFLYKGQMYAVTGTAKNKVSNDVATGNTVPMSGYSDADDLRMWYDYVKGENGETKIVTDYYTNQTFKAKDEGKDGTWTHVGYGLFGDYTLHENNGTPHSAKQFKIQDGNEVRYVYCVELGANISAGTPYFSKEYKEGQDSVAPWAGATGTVAQLRSVALNGFWGTTSGLGSLEAVKDLMRRNNLAAEAELLTAGKALTATQAAIWEFGAKSGNRFGNDFVTFDDETGSAPTYAEEQVIVKLRDLLVDLAKNPAKGTAEEIGADDITGATIILDKKATDAAGNVETVKDSAGNSHELYESDLSFTLAVSTSSLNGDLIVRVTDATGRTVATRRLAGDNNNSIFGNVGKKIQPDANGNYTIEDIKLAEGVTITLHLEGTQHLDDGVYIYKGKGNKQDFIGLSKLEREIDLEVNMKFEVEEPDVALQNTGSRSERTKENTYTESRTGTRTDTREDYTTEVDVEIVEEGESVKTIYADITIVEVTEETTKTEREWESEWKKYHYYNDPDDDPDDKPKKDREVLGEYDRFDDPQTPGIQEPEVDEDGNVTLQMLPKTGDASTLWMILSALSGLGLAAVSLTGKKREEDQ